jgi:hypothetical protein
MHDNTVYQNASAVGDDVASAGGVRGGEKRFEVQQ